MGEMNVFYTDSRTETRGYCIDQIEFHLEIMGEGAELAQAVTTKLQGKVN